MAVLGEVFFPLRDGAVGGTGDAVSALVGVFPYGVLLLLHAAWAALHTRVTILKVHTLHTLVRSLQFKKNY